MGMCINAIKTTLIDTMLNVLNTFIIGLYKGVIIFANELD